LQDGDLLFLPGNPPRVGHLLPSHYNHVLGRQSHRDLAMTAPLVLPPQVVSPRVYKRTSERWEPMHLPHGLCLGGDPPRDRPNSPGLTLAAYLRWAAVRIATNGRFNANDN
jgi:hypothetical protein